MNKYTYELLRNIEILAFINPKKIKSYVNFLKNNIFVSEDEYDFIKYFEKFWINKRVDQFNYYHLINDINLSSSPFSNGDTSP